MKRRVVLWNTFMQEAFPNWGQWGNIFKRQSCNLDRSRDPPRLQITVELWHMIFFSGKSNNVEINWLQSSSDKNSSFSSRIAPLWGRHCLELEMVKPWQTNWFPGFVATIDLSELRQLFQDKVSAFRNWSSNILPTEHGYKHGDEVVTLHSQFV